MSMGEEFPGTDTEPVVFYEDEVDLIPFPEAHDQLPVGYDASLYSGRRFVEINGQVFPVGDDDMVEVPLGWGWGSMKESERPDVRIETTMRPDGSGHTVVRHGNPEGMGVALRMQMAAAAAIDPELSGVQPAILRGSAPSQEAQNNEYSTAIHQPTITGESAYSGADDQRRGFLDRALDAAESRVGSKGKRTAAERLKRRLRRKILLGSAATIIVFNTGAAITYPLLTGIWGDPQAYVDPREFPDMGEVFAGPINMLAAVGIGDGNE